MKKSPLPYIIFILFFIAGFAVMFFLEPFPNSFFNNSGNDYSELESDNNNLPNDDNLSGNPNYNESTIYATALDLNIPDKVYVAKNQKVKLLDGFYSVTPQNATVNVEISFSSLNSSDITKVTFTNNEFVSSATGLYKMQIKIKSGAYEYLEKETTFEVVDEDPNISKIETQLLESNSYSISSLFEIKNTTASKSFNTDSLLEYNSSTQTFTATNFGRTTIEIIFTESFVKYGYSFKFDILEKFDYKIKVKSHSILDITYDEATRTMIANINTGETIRIEFAYYDYNTDELYNQTPTLNITPSDYHVVNPVGTNPTRFRLIFNYDTAGVDKKELILTVSSADEDIDAEPLTLKIIFTKPVD